MDAYLIGFIIVIIIIVVLAILYFTGQFDSFIYNFCTQECDGKIYNVQCDYKDREQAELKTSDSLIKV